MLLIQDVQISPGETPLQSHQTEDKNYFLMWPAERQ